MVLYYTGTGNSRHIAEQLARELSDSLYRINDGLRAGGYPDLTSEERLIFSVPTYAWRMPRLVSDWIRAGDVFSGKSVWFVLNCGDSIGNAAKYLRSLCAEKGIAYMGCARIRMPENYIALYDCPSESKSIQIVEKADRELPALVLLMQSGQILPDVPISFSGRLCSSVVNPLFYAFYVGSRKFRVSDACTGCGKCVRVCPLNNIRPEKGKPVWNGHCTHCMACICGCPSEAIEYGNRSVGKRRYHCPESTRI